MSFLGQNDIWRELQLFLPLLECPGKFVDVKSLFPAQNWGHTFSSIPELPNRPHLFDWQESNYSLATDSLKNSLTHILLYLRCHAGTGFTGSSWVSSVGIPGIALGWLWTCTQSAIA
jgi:hypothetical protein